MVAVGATRAPSAAQGRGDTQLSPHAALTAAFGQALVAPQRRTKVAAPGALGPRPALRHTLALLIVQWSALFS